MLHSHVPLKFAHSQVTDPVHDKSGGKQRRNNHRHPESARLVAPLSAYRASSVCLFRAPRSAFRASCSASQHPPRFAPFASQRSRAAAFPRLVWRRRNEAAPVRYRNRSMGFMVIKVWDFSGLSGEGAAWLSRRSVGARPLSARQVFAAKALDSGSGRVSPGDEVVEPDGSCAVYPPGEKV